jgi:glycosyltransferase 2 family protein
MPGAGWKPAVIAGSEAQRGSEAVPEGIGARLRRSWRFVLRLALSAGLLTFLFTRVDLERLSGILNQARPGLLAAVLGLLVVDRGAAALRWYVLLRGRNPSVSLAAVTKLIFVSGFVGYFMPGNVGVELFRVYGLTRATSDISLAIASVLVERVFALLALILLVLIGLALQPGLPPAIGGAAAIGLGGLGAAVVALFEPRARRLTLALLAPAWLLPARRGLERIHGVLDGYRRQPWLMLGSLVLAVLFQLVRCVTPAVGAAALGMSVPLVVFVAVMPVVVLLTLLPISIAGFGVQEAGFVYLFGLAGMSVEGALLLSLLIHIFVLLAVLPGAWLYATRGL